MKWKSIIGTILLIVGVIFNWQWLWVLLALSATLDAFLTGKIFLFEEIGRTKEPNLYWVQMALLVFFDLYLVYEVYGHHFLT